MIERPKDRDLNRDELKLFVNQLAECPELWSHLARHDSDQRHFEQLLRDEHLTVWVIGWMEDHDTGFHDHDLSSGAVAVVRGALREQRLTLGGPPSTNVYGAGEAFDFTASDIHRVTHAGTGPALSLHAYSPPLWRMGAYLIEPNGALRRESISYAEELRPLAA